MLFSLSLSSFLSVSLARSVSVWCSGENLFGYKTWKHIRKHSGCKKPIKCLPEFAFFFFLFVSGRKPETISIHLTIKTKLILNQIARSELQWQAHKSSHQTPVWHRRSYARTKSTLGKSHKISGLRPQFHSVYFSKTHTYAERTKCPFLSIQISAFGFVWTVTEPKTENSE